MGYHAVRDTEPTGTCSEVARCEYLAKYFLSSGNASAPSILECPVALECSPGCLIPCVLHVERGVSQWMVQ